MSDPTTTMTLICSECMKGFKTHKTLATHIKMFHHHRPTNDGSGESVECISPPSRKLDLKAVLDKPPEVQPSTTEFSKVDLINNFTLNDGAVLTKGKNRKRRSDTNNGAKRSKIYLANNDGADLISPENLYKRMVTMENTISYRRFPLKVYEYFDLFECYEMKVLYFDKLDVSFEERGTDMIKVFTSREIMFIRLVLSAKDLRITAELINNNRNILMSIFKKHTRSVKTTH